MKRPVVGVVIFLALGILFIAIRTAMLEYLGPADIPRWLCKSLADDRFIPSAVNEEYIQYDRGRRVLFDRRSGVSATRQQLVELATCPDNSRQYGSFVVVSLCDLVFVVDAKERIQMIVLAEDFCSRSEEILDGVISD